MRHRSPEAGDVGMKVFGFPFAGGDAHCYNSLRKHLPVSVELSTLEPAGRGRRSSEALRTDINGMADDAMRRVMGQAHPPFLLFGHSMGSLVAYEVARRLFRENQLKPCHLMVSGKAAPRIPERDRRWDLPGAEFREALRELGGCSEEVLNNEELMAYVEPVMRADFQAVENYHPPHEDPMDIGISVLIGDDDDVSVEEAQAWQLETTQPVRIVRFVGGHFFLFEHAAEVARLMADVARVCDKDR
jgi:surfactin synthase thioesterase subunit